MAERVSNAGKTHSIELIFFPLFILLIVGILANVFLASGIQTAPTLPPNPPQFCQAVAICYATNKNGCDSNLSLNCNFTSTTKYSFLNANSPFTFLVQGNILGFLSSAFNSGETPNILKSGYTICIPQNQAGTWQNQTGNTIHRLECLGLSSQGGNASVPAQFPNVGIPMNATSNGGNTSNWDITGCLLISTPSIGYPCQFTNTRTHPGNNNQSWFGNTTIGAGSVFNSQMSFYAFYIKNGTTLSKSQSCPIYLYNTPCSLIAPYLFGQFPTFTCPTTHLVFGLNINKTTYYCLIPTANQNTTIVGSTSNPATLPNAFSALSFLFGVALFFLGMGLALTTALIGFEVNSAGTRMAQVMGIGITLWSFIYGEFGGWLSFLPFNIGLIAFLTFTAMFFMGIYWRIFSWE